MQMDPDKEAAATADAIERVMGDIGMNSLSKSFKVGRFSMDVENVHELELDCKLSTNTSV